jgi:hypothetical protein
MPVIDGWYNVYNEGQTLSGQLRVKIAPELRAELDGENIDGENTQEGKKQKEETENDLIVPTSTYSPSSPLGATTVTHEYQYNNEGSTVIDGSSTSSLGLLRGIVKDLDDVQMRLRTSIRGRGKQLKKTGVTMTAIAKVIGEQFNININKKMMVPSHLHPVSTGMSNSPNNWLNQRSYSRKRVASAASE